jgi:hypothetical protein
MANVNPRTIRTISVKLMGADPVGLLAFQKFLLRHFDGDARATSGIRAGDKKLGSGRFPADFFSYLLVTFEVTPAGDARPTQRVFS